MKRLLIFGVLSFLAGKAFSQHQEVPAPPSIWEEQADPVPDSNSLLQAFRKGQLHGHFRYYFMATDNQKGLTDYYANAAGGGLKFVTAPYHGFQLGISGFLIYNLKSSDLTVPDAGTKQPNRYEIGLFDQEDPTNKSNINRIEELFLSYRWKKNRVALGKQLINTPIINLQDGRMRPTSAEGIWTNIKSIPKLNIEGGYLYGISPRGTTRWFTPGKSLGIYPVGVNPDGTRSGYFGHTTSKGLILAGVTYQPDPKINLMGWEFWADNLFNTVLLQADYTAPLQDGSKWVAGIQAIRQDGVDNGGNDSALYKYFAKGNTSFSFGSRIGWENKRWQTSLNFNRITSQGRYLIPREWGRDPFYSFMPRERNEGLGDVNAYMARVRYSFLPQRLKSEIAVGYFDLPAANNYRLNKYGFPSYTQVNIDLRYTFKGVFQGTELQLLYVYKGKSGNSFGNDKYIFNKVNMSSWNMVLNFHF